jgi:hypothetical protein
LAILLPRSIRVVWPQRAPSLPLQRVPVNGRKRRKFLKREAEMSSRDASVRRILFYLRDGIPAHDETAEEKHCAVFSQKGCAQLVNGRHWTHSPAMMHYGSSSVERPFAARPRKRKLRTLAKCARQATLSAALPIIEANVGFGSPLKWGMTVVLPKPYQWLPCAGA